jgi:hypothetical protein
MQAAPIHRWGLGFIAMRWRHVFWLLPLAGLLIGLGLQLWTLYGPTAVGIIQARPIPGSHVLTFPLDVATVLQSEATLSKTADSLRLRERWASNPEMCVLKLGKMIRSQRIPGTSLIEVRVAGLSRKESIEIWKALLAHTNQHFADIRRAADDAKLAAMEATIQAMELDLDQKRSELSTALRSNNLIPDAPSSPYDQENDAELKKPRADFEAAQKALEAAKIHLLSSQMGCRLMENPIIAHEEPALHSLTQRETQRDLLLHAGIGLSIGVLLTVLVAYLLEWMCPRRQEVHMDGSNG